MTTSSGDNPAGSLRDNFLDALSDDPLCRWAAQDGTRARTFTGADGAIAVASPDLSMRDRLAVNGPADAVIPLVREVLREVGPSYRPIGDRELIATLAHALPQLRPRADFGWMQTSTASPPSPAPAGPRPGGHAVWLPPSAAPEINALLDTAFPSSYARPGAHRWAGVRDPRTGRLAATAALAWCAPTVGYIAGVATSPTARGQGLGRAACAFVIAEALAAHGTAALMVADDNTPAVALYRSLGLSYRPLGAAGVADSRSAPGSREKSAQPEFAVLNPETPIPITTTMNTARVISDATTMNNHENDEPSIDILQAVHGMTLRLRAPLAQTSHRAPRFPPRRTLNRRAAVSGERLRW